ncbi:MAG: alpha/beta hydrolase [Hyphomicrobiales bacterium]|nr:alpha/beta hydrolase [Hyphomicrobiales bacterium]
MSENSAAGEACDDAASPRASDVFVSAMDGLRLHVKVWPAQGSVAAPLVCLPGLARTAADFDAVAAAVSSGRGCEARRVLAFDYRGRGLSDYDKDWRKYDIFVENQDILTVLAALGVEEADFLGTSRGGLHIMLMAVTRPGMLRRVILNDIGPVIEAKGLARIRGYVGKLPAPKSWNDAVDMFHGIMSTQFTGISDEEWMIYAKLTFREDNGDFVPRYDKKLMKQLEALDLSVPLPQLWPQFDGLRRCPMLAIRGENSDLLAQATLEKMASSHPDCSTYIVPGQGHAPLLLDHASIGRISAFLAEGDQGKTG